MINWPNQRYPAVTSSLPNKVHYAAADLGYDDHKLYKFSTDKGFELVLLTNDQMPFK
ncbi:MAG TPA: hypothetical protein VEL11_01540 [Candidatus Bathyarchaeia archaeon]|nr:hypothetical protein [Candidatus Bathyarchaeia archaeon]